MLDAKVQALTTKLLVDSLAVRRSELDFYSFSLNAIILASTALYLGALSVWGGYLFPVDRLNYNAGTGLNYPARWLYHTTMVGGMMIQFLCMIVGILAVIMAPGLALRGPEGSMDKAIEGMRYLTEKLSAAIILSLGLFQISMIVYCWTQEPEGFPAPDDPSQFAPFPYWTSALANVAFLSGLFLAAWFGRSIYGSLWLDRKTASSDITGAAAQFANTAIVSALNPQQPGQPQYNTFAQSQANIHTPDAAMADSAIRSVATKAKPKGFFKQIWDGSS